MAVFTVLGAGVMGSSMAMPLRDRGHTVRLVGTPLDDHIVGRIKAENRHPKLQIAMPPGISAHHHGDFARALGDDTDIVLLGVSSAGIPWAIDRLNATLRGPIKILMITKGMWPEAESLTALPDHVARSCTTVEKVAAIGGPCIAGELAARRTTGTVIVSRDPSFAQELCAMLESSYYHPRPSGDLEGIEVCAAFKNFFAIAVGWAAGRLEREPPAENKAFNHNPAAIIFAQAVKELSHLATALGGKLESATGMAGAGDLYVTCMAGRNSRLGNHLGRGMTYAEVMSGPMKDDTIEGAELGIAAAASLGTMMRLGKLPSLPLTNSLLDALTQDRPLVIPWAEFHRE